MFKGLVIGLLVVILGNQIYLERTVAKLKNETKHIKESIEHLQATLYRIGG